MEPASVIEQANAAMQKVGGMFSGDEKAGTFSLNSVIGSVSGSYQISDSQLHIQIDQKPMFVSCDRIEKELRKHVHWGSVINNTLLR